MTAGIRDLILEWTGRDVRSVSDLNDVMPGILDRAIYDICQEKYGDHAPEAILSHIQEWDRGDVDVLREYLEDAWAHPSIIKSDVWALRYDDLLRQMWLDGVSQNFIDYPSVIASGEIVAVDKQGRALIAMEDYEGETYYIKEDIPPTSESDLQEKSDWLEKYAMNPHAVIRPFIQYDCWPAMHDDFLQPDEDGDCFTVMFCRDVRISGPELAVRIQIHRDAGPDVVLRLLKKTISHIEKSGLYTDPEGVF